jgi:hypothetical protein
VAICICENLCRIIAFRGAFSTDTEEYSGYAVRNEKASGHNNNQKGNHYDPLAGECKYDLQNIGKTCLSTVIFDDSCGWAMVSEGITVIEIRSMIS